ncbi:SDR family oxidoreductase [Streptomyces sp. NBRC 109706]|uniref:SDR family oxidoreductase n=1 Tax=Streptomyces sp. NBRC 109706 TaxID=1550035 RepID=UPI000784B41D|nr:SDR family oxidoreductase [Streptomyces sp. NBRC 109706]
MDSSPRHVAIVTGANHGIGAAIAETLARNDIAVLCAYLRAEDEEDGKPAGRHAHRKDGFHRDPSSSGEEVALEIRDRGGRAAAFEADLRDPTAPARIFDAAEELLGPVDILINNASGWVQDTFRFDGEPDQFGRTTVPVDHETISQQFAVDAHAPALLIAELARRHRAREADWGRIVGLTSGGDLGFPGEVSYGAAKAAQTHYTMSAAVELVPDGITANVVHPPVTDTGWVTDEVRDYVRASSSHFHIANPAEVAATVAFLVSYDADLITGNVITMR